MFIVNSTDRSIRRIHGWAEQLAALTRIAWTGKDGRCYFPYLPLTTKSYWQQSVSKQWEKGEMLSWALVSGDGQILSHATLVKKIGYYELGRMVSYSESPKGAVTILCREAMKFISDRNGRVLVEATQAHTISQFICETLGLRFAGIGFLDVIEGVSWDIIYYDNLSIEDFSPQAGVLGNPLGVPLHYNPAHRKRLEEVAGILTSERGGSLPPLHFHTLSHRIETVRLILQQCRF